PPRAMRGVLMKGVSMNQEAIDYYPKEPGGLREQPSAKRQERVLVPPPGKLSLEPLSEGELVALRDVQSEAIEVLRTRIEVLPAQPMTDGQPVTNFLM